MFPYMGQRGQFLAVVHQGNQGVCVCVCVRLRVCVCVYVCLCVCFEKKDKLYKLIMHSRNTKEHNQ